MASPVNNPSPLSGDTIVDVITSGYAWQLDDSRTITFSVSNGFDGERWDQPEQVALQLARAMGVFAQYIDVRFEFVGIFETPLKAAQGGSVINLSIGSNGTLFTSSNEWAVGLPADASFNQYYLGAPGDVFINLDSPAVSLPSYAPGSQGWFLLLHELGHALGLKHPHDDGGYDRPTFAESGLRAFDVDWASIMSYNDNAPWNQVQWDPATPMLFDVIGLMALYGKNTATNLSDSTIPLANTGAYYTVWDASGIDTLDASSAEEGWAVELTDLTLSATVNERIGYAAPLSQIREAFPSTLQWFIGDYENVIGSDHADFFIGNGLANVIDGGGGNDAIHGVGGDDAIDGGTGLDEAIFFSTLENFQIELPSRSVGMDTFLFSPHQGYSMVRDLRDGSQDTLINVERLAFTDTMLALDTAANENAGNAYLLYQAAFDRIPDVEGLGYWIAQMDNGANAVRDMAMNFILSSEFTSLYGPNPSVLQFMDLIYENVLNRAPDAAGYAYWLDEFARDGDSTLYRAGILNNFAIGDENVRNVASQIADGIQYQAYVG